MRRGLTMLEMLLALALMTAVLAALVTVVHMIASATVSVAAPLQWEAAADRVVQLVRADVLSGDFGPEDRVTVTDDGLRIRTRASAHAGVAGPVTHRYALRAEGRLELEAHGAGGRPERRVLLEGVRSWTCGLAGDGRALTLAIASNDGLLVEREVPLR